MALPPSSPRLPSPPPAAEIQIGPKSPAASGATLAQQQIEQQMEQTILDANAKRRIHSGTRAADFAAGPPLVPLNELDSAFQLQEHLAALHYHHTANNTVPISRETAHILAQAPAGTDRTLWLYELCRFLIKQCNSLIVGFLFDTPACSAATCPEMRASEWQFLCAVHEQPRSCCAIDYCCHTLDWAANVVTNPKIFPSRFVFADPHDKNAAVKNLINVFRRLHRIFAHAWFQHRGVFWSVEGQTGLYVFFKTVCDMYDLLPAENYKLPPEAEGLDTTPSVSSSGAAVAGESGTATATSSAPAEPSAPGLIPMSSIADKKSLAFNPSGERSLPHRTAPGAGGLTTSGTTGTGLAADLLGGDSDHLQSIGRTNTRRHIRSSPSTGSAVTTVLEQDEDGQSAPSGGRPFSILQNTNHLGRSSSHASGMPPQVSEQEVPADDAEAEADSETSTTASVPIIVEHDQHDLASSPSTKEDTAETPTSAVEAPAPTATESTEAESTEPSAESAAESSADSTDAKPSEEEEPAEPVTIIVAGELAEAGGKSAGTKAELPKEESAEAEAEAEAPAATETATEEAEAPAEKTDTKDAKDESDAPAATEEEAPVTEAKPATEDAPKEAEEAPEASTAEDKEATETESKTEADAEAKDDAPKAEDDESKSEAKTETEAATESTPAADD